MIQEHEMPYFDETVRGIDDPVHEGPGPQGAALILELQKLRHAFEAEGFSDRRARASPGDGTQRKQQQGYGPPKQRRRKGRVEQAIDICLQPFRLKAPAPPERKAQTRVEARVEARAQPPRRRSVPDAPPKPAPTRLATPRPDGLHQSMRLDRIDAALPGSAKTETAISHTIERCRTSLTAGAHFILHGDSGAAIDAGEHSLIVRAGRAFEHELRTGLRILILAVLLAGGWLVFMPLAGAVVVPGNLVVQSNVKQIQHPTGGVVAEIKVHNGTRVDAGDLLVRLDAVQAQASLQVVTKQLDEIRARMARLEAERDGLAQIEFSA
jgi:HlyD family secretion protein